MCSWNFRAIFKLLNIVISFDDNGTTLENMVPTLIEQTNLFPLAEKWHYARKYGANLGPEHTGHFV